ncbi:microsomal glutathione S-transferase 1 [Procambarus clarkii]|uniref:microsomal glutathione S-transferase 1 n=1 Tax=Procambarus clarkii TaxID=6728 RepID=UPI001E673587|nr:microsomal glutathione S-transferase 1-like [Procambarus clarkii]XP_045580973.1 microsomal glutathione S-transferase 1-like [Procambarus clarkii]XP_045580974.1 microsomal glutathione S-transferase 1-like [Procambarus clarkii]XP_045580976.1 microsomal glutathione S-transferase 1-like [Procambarus clarkii]XP_045580977.1 microsomal glutathione S-transferase 1-like [Procambarus clarkii]
MSGWNLENPVFSSYVFWSGVLAAKMLLMGPITGYFRITRKAFANPEDVAAMGGKDVKTNSDVERVRRAHQNDLENIPVFWVCGLLYVLTNPSLLTASILFRIYASARILHTVFYLRGSFLRGFSYFAGMVVKFFMVGTVLYTFW